MASYPAKPILQQAPLPIVKTRYRPVISARERNSLGHHWAQPILRRFGHETTVRASLALYNTCEEVDVLVTAMRQLTASPAKTYR
jgi:hypothetical protein